MLATIIIREEGAIWAEAGAGREDSGALPPGPAEPHIRGRTQPVEEPLWGEAAEARPR